MSIESIKKYGDILKKEYGTVIILCGNEDKEKITSDCFMCGIRTIEDHLLLKAIRKLG